MAHADKTQVQFPLYHVATTLFSNVKRSFKHCFVAEVYFFRNYFAFYFFLKLFCMISYTNILSLKTSNGQMCLCTFSWDKMCPFNKILAQVFVYIGNFERKVVDPEPKGMLLSKGRRCIKEFG